ncbi:hypothetical protein GCM10022267_11790 [Lentzea roselyniae]|uniref:Uncharacterized protein n=1 Tax=Lentzea roselyniae TaxID=531940 RepID=A0ABP7A8Q5_9PSEU
MRNEFTGRARTSFQFGNVEGDVIVGRGSKPDRGARSKPPAKKQKATPGQFLAGILAFFVLGAIANACDAGAKDTDFPATDQGSRPSEVSDDAVAQVVANKLQQCTTEVVLAPANCPQTHAAVSARNVRWELVGDPRDGMQVRWQDGKFVARGTAVMTVSYDSYSGPDFAIKGFHFLTDLPWRGADTRIDMIHQPKTAPAAGTISKDRFTLPDGDLIKAVRDGFAACASATGSPLPPTCPRTATTPSATNASWSVEGDPVANWTTAGDKEFGLLRLTASYSLVASWKYTFFVEGVSTHTQAGTYEATLIRTPNKTARLLAIKHVP